MSNTRCIADRTITASFLAATVGFGSILGCASTPQNDSPAQTASSSSNDPVASTPAQTIQEVERRYVVGPIAARELGYQVDWQAIDAGPNLRIFHVSGDSVFALDERNFLTRLDRTTGRRIWRVPVAEAIQQIIAINYIGDEVYLTGGGRLFVLDAATGTQTGLQRLEKIAATPPIHSGAFLIYGGRNGQLIWHSHEVAFQWRAYQISPSINVSPLLVQDDPYEAGHVVTVGSDGRVTVHKAATAAMLWDKRLLDSVAARPASSRGAIFVAGLDQHLWAYDLYTGRSLWRYLTDTPLTEPPVAIEDRVYQQISTEGLVCFAATPLDSPGGEILWAAEGVLGSVAAQRGNRLYVWNAQDRQMTVLDARRGGRMNELNLNQASRIVAADINGSELYAVGDDGRIVRLLPRN